MKRYKLLKDLPTFKAGSEFDYDKINGLTYTDGVGLHRIYTAAELENYPNILIDWFEEIPEEPKTVYDLREGDECWMLDLDLEPSKIEWRGTPYDIRLRELGKIYPTKKELEKQIAWEEAKQILLRDTKGFKPNWEDDTELKWYVEYDTTRGDFGTDCYGATLVSGELYFASQQDAQASYVSHPSEWKTYLGVE